MFIGDGVLLLSRSKGRDVLQGLNLRIFEPRSMALIFLALYLEEMKERTSTMY